MWVLLEGSPSPLKVKPQNIVFLQNNNILKPNEDVQTLANIATVENPLVVRYPISAVNIKVAFTWGKKSGKREIPHTSGSFSLLIAFAKEKWDDLREEEIYFVNDETDILDAYNFNIVEEIDKFFGELESHLMNVQKELDNESSARFIIDPFLSAAVSHIQEFINDSVRLGFEKELKGSRDKIGRYEARNGAKYCTSAQRIGTTIEVRPSGTKDVWDSYNWKFWRFVRWTGSLDEPVVHVSEEYTCNFAGNLENEKKMIEYIARILQDQVTTFCDHDNENNLRPSKRLCTSQSNVE
ncbi:hypothetical protein C1646_779449 [Rhizophagus diaphanus]|nr:hypothetical protein C1646_779449 [Rhizophagus diaphanus] [Rhizophagus sp. MUCL 43196]